MGEEVESRISNNGQQAVEQPVYVFHLRDDMPMGLNLNGNYPELPAAVEFLKQFQGKAYQSPKVFRSILEGFSAYLIEHEVPCGHDPELRTGLKMKRSQYEWANGRIYDYVIYTAANNCSGGCAFGGLERVVDNVNVCSETNK